MHTIFKRFSVLVSKKTIFNNTKKWQWETDVTNHPFSQWIINIYKAIQQQLFMHCLPIYRCACLVG